MLESATPKRKSRSKWFVIAGSVVALYVIGRISGGNNSEKSENIANAMFSLKAVAGKSTSDVESQLGKGVFVSNWVDKRAGCTKCPKYTYKGDSLEIIYINGKADRITINYLGNYDFSENLITGLGLPFRKPDFQSSSAIRWNNYEGFREITAFEDGKEHINFVLIKTQAE